jgi:ribosomal protein S12 methylthiotransferase
MEGDRVVTTPEYTAYLRIAEGCNNRCSYCAIPAIRGKMRSRRIEDIVAEARTLRQMGVKELCLVAQDTTGYGKDLYGEYCLDKLLEAICSESDLDFKWIRLFYCYPDKITDGLLKVMKKYPNILHYIDMPIQHISDKVLERMNRHGKSEIIKDSVRRLREAMPDMVIRTTVMVGFPGETGADFEELLSYVREAKFDRLGCFCYSREEDTPAYGFDGRVPQKTKERRMERVMEAQFEINRLNSEAQIGEIKEVLCEGYDPVGECWFGRSWEYAPEIDGRVYFKTRKRPEVGSFVKVKITEVLDYDLLGEAVREEK